MAAYRHLEISKVTSNKSTMLGYFAEFIDQIIFLNRPDYYYFKIDQSELLRIRILNWRQQPYGMIPEKCSFVVITSWK